MHHRTHDPDRALLEVSGEDTRSFLQGLITGDIETVTPERAIWAALLTPQGKYLFDFFVFEDNGAVLIDVHKSRAADLLKRLKLYKLRAKVAVADVSDRYAVSYLWGEAPDAAAGTAHRDGEALLVTDPRHAGLGYREFAPTAAPSTDSLEAYHGHRIALGVPEGVVDLPLEKATLVENGFDELGGVAWNKGCYVGQEVTARMKYKGLAKKRLLPVTFDGAAPTTGDTVTADGKDVGEIRSVGDGVALAMLRLDALEKPLSTGDTALAPRMPDWVQLPEKA
ncbi:MAG: folate-binding protein [Alphaproteobacteria bacterium]|nr:folate-binding protein [Alphaproteobacteria bacterium]